MRLAWLARFSQEEATAEGNEVSCQSHIIRKECTWDLNCALHLDLPPFPRALHVRKEMCYPPEKSHHKLSAQRIKRYPCNQLSYRDVKCWLATHSNTLSQIVTLCQWALCAPKPCQKQSRETAGCMEKMEKNHQVFIFTKLVEKPMWLTVWGTKVFVLVPGV